MDCRVRLNLAFELQTQCRSFRPLVGWNLVISVRWWPPTYQQLLTPFVGTQTNVTRTHVYPSTCLTRTPVYLNKKPRKRVTRANWCASIEQLLESKNYFAKVIRSGQFGFGRQCGFAGGEQVHPGPLCWYFIICSFFLSVEYNISISSLFDANHGREWTDMEKVYFCPQANFSDWKMSANSHISKSNKSDLNCIFPIHLIVFNKKRLFVD